MVNEGVSNVEDVVEREQHLRPEAKGALRPKTRWNLQKVLRYRPGNATSELTSKAQEHIVSLHRCGYDVSHDLLVRIPFPQASWL